MFKERKHKTHRADSLQLKPQYRNCGVQTQSKRGDTYFILSSSDLIKSKSHPEAAFVSLCLTPRSQCLLLLCKLRYGAMWKHRGRQAQQQGAGLTELSIKTLLLLYLVGTLSRFYFYSVCFSLTTLRSLVIYHPRHDVTGTMMTRTTLRLCCWEIKLQ